MLNMFLNIVLKGIQYGESALAAFCKTTTGSRNWLARRLPLCCYSTSASTDHTGCSLPTTTTAPKAVPRTTNPLLSSHGQRHKSSVFGLLEPHPTHFLSSLAISGTMKAALILLGLCLVGVQACSHVYTHTRGRSLLAEASASINKIFRASRSQLALQRG